MKMKRALLAVRQALVLGDDLEQPDFWRPLQLALVQVVQGADGGLLGSVHHVEVEGFDVILEGLLAGGEERVFDVFRRACRGDRLGGT